MVSEATDSRPPATLGIHTSSSLGDNRGPYSCVRQTGFRNRSRGGGGAVEATAERAGGLSVRCQGLVHLYKTFEGHDVVALQGVDLAVAEGERVAFLGPSGSGKSTLLTLFGGIQRPSAG